VFVVKRVALLEGIPKVADIADNDRGARILEFVPAAPPAGQLAR
jgi:hypothetical protein